MSWQAAPRGKRGRTQTYSDAAIPFCLAIKNLFGLTLRQTVGVIQSLLKPVGLNWSVPDYSMLSSRQQTLQVRTPYQKSLAAVYRRQWRRVHLGMGAETLQISAIEIKGKTLPIHSLCNSATRQQS